MEIFDESGAAAAMEMGVPMDMVAEEVVTQDEGRADSDGLSAALDSLTSLPSLNMLSKFGKELGCLEDSSEDEDLSPAESGLYVSEQNAAEEGGGDLWSGNARDDCLCWECGERFSCLDLLMEHFRTHEAGVRCNMCQVTFRRVVSLSMHLDNVHNSVDLYCAPCRLPFHSKWDLNEHLGKHGEPAEQPITPALPPPQADRLVQEKMRLHPADTKEVEPVPKPASLPVSVPMTQSVPVSVHSTVPVTVSTLASAPVSKPIPASAAVPLTLPVSVPIFLPVSVPIHTSVPGPISVPTPVSVSLPVPVSAPGPVPVPLPVSTSSPSSTTNGKGYPLDELTLHALVAKDHAYNNTRNTDNGVAGSSYALRMRRTKKPTKALPQQSLPQSTQQKIQLFVFRKVDQQQENVAGVAGGERDRHTPGLAEERDVKPDASSLIPLRPSSLASLDHATKIKQESVDPRSEEVQWEGEPIEDDEDLNHSEEEVQSDETMSFEDCSEYDPGSASDVSTESMSSGNSSGSSYSPNKRRGKRARIRGGFRSRKLGRGELSLVPIAPALQPVASDAVKVCQSSRDQPKPQASFQAAVTLKIPATPPPGDNKCLSRPALRPSRMYACDQCREVFPEQVTYRRHHCLIKKAAIVSLGAPASVPVPVTTAATIQNPPMDTAPSASSLVSAPGPMPSSSSGVMKVTQMATPCTIQNSTLVSPLPVAGGPVFTLPSMRLPSPSPSVQAGSQAVMATVVFNGSGPAGRVTRLVLQSQGLTFPTHTLSQTRPIRLSVPSQAKGPTPGQASPFMKLTKLTFEGLNQPQKLLKSPHLTQSSAPSPVPVPTPASAPIPGPVLIAVPTPTSVAGPAPVSAPSLISATAPITVPTLNTAPSSITIPSTITGPTPIKIPTTITGPAPLEIHTSITVPPRITVPPAVTGLTPNIAPAPRTIPTANTAPAPRTIPTANTAPAPRTIPTAKTDPAPRTIFTAKTDPVLRTIPTAKTDPAPRTICAPSTANDPITASFLIPFPNPPSASFPPPDSGPLKILGIFANRSRELALKKRLNKSWRSKGVFLCRQCGAISRQPSLGVRHRYLHRGSRRHRCHCGRTFLRRLHLLRHHVQHAEATSFVCAPCGQTFSGAHCLARHKNDQERKRKKWTRPRKDCHTPFSCDCGQIFHRPTAFLWHKLKNPKQQGVGLKQTQRKYPNDNTGSVLRTPSL